MNTRTIEIPPYITPWDMEEQIARCLRTMEGDADVYMLDMSAVKNVYSATARLIMRLYDRAGRRGAMVRIINACEAVHNALRTLQIHTYIPVSRPEETMEVLGC
jgi:anti-anti-sigma regulatory factor